MRPSLCVSIAKGQLLVRVNVPRAKEGDARHKGANADERHVEVGLARVVEVTANVAPMRGVDDGHERPTIGRVLAHAHDVIGTTASRDFAAASVSLGRGDELTGVLADKSGAATNERWCLSNAKRE